MSGPTDPLHAEFSSPSPQVQAWRDEATLHIRFNNPARHNALSVDMWQAVPVLLAQAAADPRIRLVVFSGAGDKAFVSGADISQFEDQRAAQQAVERYEAMAEAALASIEHSPVPTLACIHGWCLGGGVNVAIACDIRIAASDAVFSVPAARLGLGYRVSALKNLVGLLGPGMAKDLFFTARRVGADEARAIGLVSRVAPPADMPGLLAEYTRALAENAPLTIRAAKAVIAELLKASPEADLAHCQQLIADCFASQDYAEGRQAFMAKRRPRFTGR